MQDLNDIGREWLVEQVEGLTDEIIRIGPVEFNEEHRYLPASVTSVPGYMRLDFTPYMKEILECYAPWSPVREVNLMKGVQVAATTLLECILFYFMVHLKTLPAQFITAEKELASERMENNILPMLEHSGFSHIIRSSDDGNSRKTGKTKNHLQWEGGGYLIPAGANNPTKGRSFSILLSLQDEIDGWPDVIGKDGDPIKIFTDRCSAYWEDRKVYRCSTPLLAGTSKIEKSFKLGDQRVYLVRCLSCGFPQELRWRGKNEDTKKDFGFSWELEEGTIIPESVRYHCQNCAHPHQEHDKDLLFATESGAHWKPTARPADPAIRSYLLPAFYSPIGMQPWHKSVSSYLEAFDDETGQVKDMAKAQVFYNNVLAKTWEVRGSKVHFMQVSGHRRACYRLGQVPNRFAIKFSGSPVLFLTCQVDVHKAFLAASVFGWCRDARSYVIEYQWFEDQSDEGCLNPSSPVWGRLREWIEETEWVADDGKKYRIQLTLIDAGYANDLVVGFCADYAKGVFPTLGRERPAKNQKIQEFAEFKTQAGTTGYRILVDHYKDRIAPVLRREWGEEAGPQPRYHFNAPVDISDKSLKELTKETRREKTDDRGNVTYEWYRPGNARNELWDLLVMGHAGVEMIAWNVCVGQFERETIDWNEFWDYVETGIFYT